MVDKKLKKNHLYQLVCEAIDQKRHVLTGISRSIHQHPEVAFTEKFAARLLVDFLQENGFDLTLGVGGLETAFVARAGQGKPVVAFIAEYDALPGIGHGCGHNLIAAASVGAAVALAGVLKDNLPGQVRVVGTPAEEGGGGKVILSREGVFDDVDAAMMVHPGCKTQPTRQTMAMAPLDIAFHGRSAHAAAMPHEGKNALDAIILTFNNINALRQQMKSEARVHGIITHGGEAPNIIPDYAAARFFIRTLNKEYLKQLVKSVSDCAAGAALATGTRLEITFGKNVYDPFRLNPPLSDAFIRNLHRLKIKVDSMEDEWKIGSTDMANVSQIVPAIHPTMAITSDMIFHHTADFARAAATDEAQESMIEAAHALAMTGVDFLSDSTLREEAFKALKCSD